jgi:hypothetical protein
MDSSGNAAPMWYAVEENDYHNVVADSLKGRNPQVRPVPATPRYLI